MHALFLNGTENLLSDCSNPVLDIWSQIEGVIKDIYSLDFQIWSKADGNLSKKFPTASGIWEAVNITDDCPSGNRLGLGHYVIPFDPSSWDPVVGLYETRLRVKNTDESEYKEFAFDWELIQDPISLLSPSYAFIADMREEGVPASSFADIRLMKALARATKEIIRFTQRQFGVYDKILSLDGRDKPALLLEEPIIGLSDIQIISDYVTVSGQYDVNLEEIAIYNRHLTQGLIDPDDRDSPKVTLEYWEEPGTRKRRRILGQEVFPYGRQNVKLTGLFGYTEPDGSFTGQIPVLIREVCIKMALRHLQTSYAAYQAAGGDGSRVIVKERTRDQEVQYATPKQIESSRVMASPFTGDPDIDNILLAYVAPMHMGAV